MAGQVLWAAKGQLAVLRCPELCPSRFGVTAARWWGGLSAPLSAGQDRKRRQALRVWGVGTMEACDTRYDDAGRMIASDQEANVLTYSSIRW
jgi:hypothetical protein